jgi:hypothetical protein
MVLCRTLWGSGMDETEGMLKTLYQARLDNLRQIAVERDVAKVGNVEKLRARLIAELVLSDFDLSWEGIQNASNDDLGGFLGIFGVKKTGSIKVRRQRLWLHLNHDPKQLTIDYLQKMTRDELHALCINLELPRSGNKTDLFSRVAGVLVSHENSWGKIKKSLKRGTTTTKLPSTSAAKPSSQAVPIPAPEPSQLDHAGEMAESPAVTELVAPMTMPSSTQRASLNELMTAEEIQSLRDRIEQFVEQNSGDWSFEDEAVLRSELLAHGIPINHPRVSSALAEWLAEASDQQVASSSSVLPSPSKHEVGSEQAVLELEARNAELESSIRDFLLIGHSEDSDDLDSFFSSLGRQGFAVEFGMVRQHITTKLSEISALVEAEREAVHLGPDSWREREEIRRLEGVRPQLLDGLDSILDACAGDMVQGRLEFEKLARESGLDMRLPAVSGRLHGLFDLQVSLNESAALNDPRIARRERIVRIMQHGAVHLSDSAQVALNRLERYIDGFEQVVEAILRKSGGEYGVGEQALLIRFLEQRGYSVNTAELRPRIVACGGVIGVELGFISPRDVPPLPSGINLSDTEIDAVVAELRSVIRQFDRPDLPLEDVEAKEEIRLGEAVVEASETLDRVKNNLERADALLSKLDLTSESN